jgi:fatty acid desaturase
MVNESMQQCPFCNASMDQQASIAAADVQDRVNRSCNDASYARTAAVAIWVFLGLSFIPLVPVVYWGFLVTFFLVIALLIRWQVKFGGLQTQDPDYSRARRSKNIALGLWLAAIPVGFIVKPLFDIILQWILGLG